MFRRFDVVAFFGHVVAFWQAVVALLGIVQRVTTRQQICQKSDGHLTTSEKTMLFAQFLLVSHEATFETRVKDKLLTIYLLSLGPEPLHEMICTNFP